MKSNKEMILEVTEQVQNHTKSVRRRRKAVASIGVVLTIFICLSVAVAAGGNFPIFSEEWRNQLFQSVSKAGEAVGVDEFRTQLEASTDRFSNDPYYKVLMDHENAIKINQTQTKDGFVFNFDSVVPAKELQNKCVSGSIIYGDAVFEWQVQDEVYAILSVKAEDGGEVPYLNWMQYVDGYEPFSTNMCMEGYGAFTVEEDGMVWYAVNISKLAAFAGDGLVLVPETLPEEGVYGFDENEHITADEYGVLSLTDKAPLMSVLFRFSLPDDFKDEDVQYQLTNEQCMRKF